MLIQNLPLVLLILGSVQALPKIIQMSSHLGNRLKFFIQEDFMEIKLYMLIHDFSSMTGAAFFFFFSYKE